ncbi:chloramphenicol acetyltransferase [Cellulophaga lytica]|uniref:chloramphenicol acetyltransferase n=1 Tax=Cellulophaga lytica TaxID=979 RepID=UPI0009504E4D|nr:chloramphenicol acetyltransferase [Cellulophaga lytica]APU12051.1 chloramphenicol acetyltransferase [Cellulophaga lytica]
MTKTLVTIDEWNRKDHYNFFSKFDEPFFGVTVTIDCTVAYKKAKASKTSFFLYYLYRALEAANQIENFKYRIIDDKVYLFDTINASPTISRPDHTFGFSFVNYNEDEIAFRDDALKVIKKVQESTSLFPGEDDKINVIHFSALPWLNFTSMSHARNYKYPDSCPKISFGKLITIDNTKTMSVSIHAHHGLVDGYHVGLFVDKFQALLNK